ncbi:MAG TPA: restriction endonuclease subunit S [Gallicola sp.]|nr:restriction endonuclease subunit S [Gallicola sp.]
MSKIDFMSLKAIDFCDDVRDGTHDSPKHLDSGKLLITSKNIKGDSIDFENASYISEEDYNKINERSLVEINDVLYSMIGTVGLVYRVDQQPNYAIKNMGLFKIHDELKSKWLYYYLNSPNAKGKVLSMLSGSTQKFISLSNLRNLEIEFPQNIDDAKRIIKICESIDKKIKLNNKINNNLLELSKQLYLNTFSNTSVFEEIKLGELCNIKYGKGLPTTQILDSGYPVYGGNGIIGYYNSKLYDESQVLVSCRGAASGKVVLSKPNSFVTNNSLILEVDRLYHHYLKEYCLLNPFFAYTTGSAQPQITINNIKDIIIKIPDATILEDFNSKCESIEIKYFLNIEQNETLEQLRDTLLPKLMNGEINLDNIEI